MSFVLALLVALVTYGGFRLAQDYVRRSMRSFGHAERAWPAVMENATKLLDKDIPHSIGKLVVGMVSTAGCGCFVRAMLVIHYLPRFPASEKPEDRYWGSVFEDMESLDSDTRQLFWKLLASVIIYDSFRNPLQGWLWRCYIKRTQAQDGVLDG